MSQNADTQQKKDFTVPDPNLAPGSVHQGFVVERAQPVAEISGTVYLMRHEASGARLAWIACEDENRTFAIGFKTPPADDTGVFHIIEHSVLCGSDRFPVKEPFVHLLKSSMQTFLNALTYPDKTLYPVSSTNVKDLENLMDIYLDAVLHPAIYRRPNIFAQEGWHYEIMEKDGTEQLVRNGVVFNEMKGAFSDPERMLFGTLSRDLFPDTPYRFESGGDPSAIPTLTYEHFIDSHARHYNLPNSYTFLYGDLDIERELAFIAERFAGAEQREVGAPNELPVQKPVVSPLHRVEMVTAPENASAAIAYVISTAPDKTTSLACNILFDALMGSNESPLKRALLEKGLAHDILCDVVDGLLQPLLFVELKGIEEGAAERFAQTFEEEVRRLVEEGIERSFLEASLSRAEFNLRERDYGSYTSGIAYASHMLHGWLYDEDAALDFLFWEDDIARMKAELDKGYFEKLLERVVLKSEHKAEVELVPVEAPEVSEEAEELARIFSGMSDEEKAAVREQVDTLRHEQEAPDTPEALATLPHLSISDIGDAPREPESVPFDKAPFPLTHHMTDTHGIAYIYNYFGLECIAFDELPYIGVLGELMGKLATKDHTATELDTRIEGELGNLSFFTEMYPMHLNSAHLAPKLVVGTSALSEKMESAAVLPAEVWSSTDFSDKDRIHSILQQRRIHMEQTFMSSGHAVALGRAAAGLTHCSLAAQQIAGIEFYRFLKELLDDFDARFEALTAKLDELRARIFSVHNLEASFSGSEADLERWIGALGTYGLSEDAAEHVLVVPDPEPGMEGFAVPGNVVYVGEVLDAGAVGGVPGGAWDVAARAISLDYLWNEVRVKGGAYGSGFRFTATDLIQMYSYRDPGVDPTIERYARAGEWLAAWDPSEETFEGFLVSIVAGYDAPTKPRAMAKRKDSRRIKKVPETWRAEVRRQVLECTPEKIHELAELIGKAQSHRSVCVFGNIDLLKASELDLDICELMGTDA